MHYFITENDTTNGIRKETFYAVSGFDANERAGDSIKIMVRSGKDFEKKALVLKTGVGDKLGLYNFLAKEDGEKKIINECIAFDLEVGIITGNKDSEYYIIDTANGLPFFFIVSGKKLLKLNILANNSASIEITSELASEEMFLKRFKISTYWLRNKGEFNSHYKKAIGNVFNFLSEKRYE